LIAAEIKFILLEGDLPSKAH